MRRRRLVFLLLGFVMACSSPTIICPADTVRVAVVWQGTTGEPNPPKVDTLTIMTEGRCHAVKR